MQIRKGKLVGAVAALLLLGLAGCGVSSTNTGGAGNVASIPTGGATKGVTHPVCPDTTTTVSWSSATSAQLSLAQPRATVTVGQSVEVALPANLQWTYSPTSGQGIVQLQQPAGYYDASRQSCIWRFVTLAKGQATLAYSRIAVCVPGTKCSQVAMAVPLDLTVS